jgi:hypothetical protein
MSLIYIIKGGPSSSALMKVEWSATEVNMAEK